MPEVLIQGIMVSYRDLLPDEEILYANLPQDEQYVRKEQHPFTDDELIAIANREHSYTPLQKQWVEREEKRFELGVYAMINGNLIYIPGAYYCYYNYWTLEHGEKPDYREDDRAFFLFHEFLRLYTDVLGLTRGKGRRQGATSIGTFFMWFIAGRNEYKNCGLTSYNDTVAQDVFQKMFMYGFKAMLPCFQADFDSDSENFIRYVKPVDKKKKGVLAVKREGLNSYVNYLPNTINSYDSGRQSYNVPDEAGKRSKVNINSYWSKLYKTFLVGANKVGFGYLPTTVNAKKEGGENYKMFWKNANQFAINKKTLEVVGLNTSNRCVRYFVPATHCYAGCIDKFGNSIIEDPKEPIMGNDGKWITEGSRTKIMRERDAIQEEEQKMEHRRDYPLDEFDMFAFESGQCEFDSERLRLQLIDLEENPVYLRKMRLLDYVHVTKSQFLGQKDKSEIAVKYMDDENGFWLLLEKPEIENDYSSFNDIYKVNAAHKYVVGADTIRIFSAEDGSKATICVFKKSCVLNGVETGNYPVAFYVGRPKLPSVLYDEIIKACLWYGCKANIERSAGDHFVEYFYKKGMDDLLLWTPARNPNKPRQEPLPGTESASPYQLSMQLECAKLYFDGDNPENYNGNVHRVKFPELIQQALDYKHDMRTPYDLVVALQMCLIAALKAPQIKTNDMKPKKILSTYKIMDYGN